MKEFFYRVQAGDCLMSVCRRFSAPPEAVIKENSLERELEEGDIIYISHAGAAKHVAATGETYFSLAGKIGGSATQLKELNGAEYLFYGYPVMTGSKD